jgi:hypothetical protein
MSRPSASALVCAIAIVSGALQAQDTTSLGCDARCMSALATLRPGARVDVWAVSGRVQGRFVRLDSTGAARPALLIRARQPDSVRTVSADNLLSLEVGVSNVPRYALIGSVAGAGLGAALTLPEAAVRFVYLQWFDPNHDVVDGRQVATYAALGAVGGAVAGAVIGHFAPRWTQRFARP